MTFFLLFSLLLFAQAIFSRDIATAEIRSSLSAPARADLLARDIAQDIMSIMNVSEPSVNRSSARNRIIVGFGALGQQPNAAMIGNLAYYRTFIESTYAPLEQANITLSALNANITVSQYNTTIAIESNQTRIYTQDFNKIRNISVRIALNVSAPFNTTQPLTSSSGQQLTLLIVDSLGATVLSTSFTLNPNITSNFSANRSGRGLLEVGFGLIDGRPGTLRIRSNNVQATPQDLKIAYEAVIPEVIVALNSTMGFEDAHILRNSTIILGRI